MAPKPTAAERLALAEEQLTRLLELLEKLWVERSMLHSAVVEAKIIKRHIELARAGIEREGS